MAAAYLPEQLERTTPPAENDGGSGCKDREEVTAEEKGYRILYSHIAT